MTETSGQSAPVHADQIDSAIAASQRLEREEREADLAKQRSADERIVQALAETRDDRGDQ